MKFRKSTSLFWPGFTLFFVITGARASAPEFESLAGEIAEARQSVADAAELRREGRDFFAKRRYRHNAGSTPDSFQPCSGRLTLQSGVPVTTSNLTGQSTLYFTPYQGTKVTIWTGTVWEMYTLNEVSLALSGLTTGKNYDVFIYYNSGFFLELSAAWTNDTTRNDAVSLLNGIPVKSADNKRRFIGTIRATSATTTEDSSSKRLVWNFYNRHPRAVYVTDSTDNWAASGTQLVWRASNNTTASSVQFLVGDADATIFMKTMSLSLDPGLAYSSTGIDSTTTTSSLAYGVNGVSAATTNNIQTPGFYIGQPGLGFHTAYWLEMWMNAAPTWYGDNANPTQLQAGMLGWIDG